MLLRIWIGVVICFVPWIEACWDRNPLLIDFPSLYFFLTQGAVRGLVSGLGLLNLWIAFQDAVRHGTDKP